MHGRQERFCSFVLFSFVNDVNNEGAHMSVSEAIIHTNTLNHPSTQPLTWQHDIKPIVHPEQVDGSRVR